jgi:hypothetical protein
MEAIEQTMFLRYLNACTHYFEYGSGGSTAWASRTPTIQSVTTVENDPAWVETVKRQCPRATIRYINTGPVRPGGSPILETTRSSWHEYYDAIRTRATDPDLILIDGRWRVACALTVLQEVPSATILIHDYTHRPSYHTLTRYLEPIEVVGTLVAFRSNGRTPPSDEIARYVDAFE